MIAVNDRVNERESRALLGMRSRPTAVIDSRVRSDTICAEPTQKADDTEVLGRTYQGGYGLPAPNCGYLGLHRHYQPKRRSTSS